VIVFHGSADATVTPANGDAVIAAALTGHAQPVRSSAPTTGKASRGARRFVWRDDGAGAQAPSLAEQWLVEGAPHAWSGGAAAGSYTDPGGPDASAEMLRFFLEHPRRA
jgi:poly(3-hydroxybutyrate) depolymerase